MYLYRMLKKCLIQALFFVLIFHGLYAQDNCNCNEREISFSKEYVNSNQLIFRGKTISITKGTDYDKVSFEIDKLFKGIASKKIDIYFDNKNVCALKFNVGEDWLIYANYKSAKAVVVYCSRSRKNVINTNKNIDLMYIKSDITVDDETEKLTELGDLKPFSEPVSENENAHNNTIPTGLQKILMIVFSALGFAGIYLIMNKFWKR